MHNNYANGNITDKSTYLYEKIFQVAMERGHSTQP